MDRHSLPWPLAGAGAADAEKAPLNLPDDASWVVEQWGAVLGSGVTSLDADFFAYGGGSLAAAQLVSALRVRYPTITVADIYATPRVGALIDAARQSLPEGASTDRRPNARFVPPPGNRRSSRPSWDFPQHPGGHALADVPHGRQPPAGRLRRFHSRPVVSWWWMAASWLVFVSPPGRMSISILAARTLLRDVKPGTYPRSGKIHLRLWLAEQIQDLSGAISLASAPWVPYYARALGAKIGNNVQLHSLPPVTGLLSLGSGCNIEPEVDLSAWWIDGDYVHIGAVHVGANATVGSRSTLMPGASIGAGGQVEPGSAVLGKVKAGQLVAGSPAERSGKAKNAWPEAPQTIADRQALVRGVCRRLGRACLDPLHLRRRRDPGGLPVHPRQRIPLRCCAAGPGLAPAGGTGLVRVQPPADPCHHADARRRAQGRVLPGAEPDRLAGLGHRAGFGPGPRCPALPIYASLFTPVWLRLLGAKVGRNVEASTVLLLPKMTTVGEGAFLADDTMVASYELGGGWMKIAPAKIGKRSFLGNSGMTAAGRSVPKNSLVAVLSATPAKAKSGTSWLGSPPVRLRRTAIATDNTRTFQPPLRLKLARAAWELCRFIPVVLTVALAAGVMLGFDWLATVAGYAAAALLGGLVLLAAGAVAAASAVAAKWLLVGRIRPGEHALWSSFIWRNEVVDTFIEMVSAPWFARAATGTPALVWWLRGLGARIGRGTWCESYWLPEADLVTLGRSATVNRGCVVQTHLFHDRIMSIDTVTLEDGATMGPHGVILPRARIGSGGTVGPASLVMRGETVPAGTYWMGNPVSPWTGPAVPARRLK